jgi:heat shock protein HslJ
MRNSIALLGAVVLTGAVCASGLQGSEWKPVALGNMLFTEETPAFIQFRSEGRLVGYGGCNRLQAEYSIADGQLSIGPVASTRMFCGDELMGLERELIGALERTRTFERQRTELILYDQSGTPVLQLRQTDWD